MANFSFNPVTKTSLDSQMKSIANEVERCILRWQRFADFLNTLTSAEQTELGYTDTEKAYIGSLRVACINMNEAYRNLTKTGNSDPSYFVKLFSDSVIF